MRLLARRWRLRTRTLMIAVAIVAVALGGWLTVERRRVEFGRRFNLHNEEQRRHLRYFDSPVFYDAGTCPDYRAEGVPPCQQTGWHLHSKYGPGPRIVRDWVGYHQAMRAKYWAAAQSPWRPVAADPPAPPRPPPGAGTVTGPTSW